MYDSISARFLITCMFWSVFSCNALIVSKASIPGAIRPGRFTNAECNDCKGHSPAPIRIRIRSTQEQDLQEIASLLASATTSDKEAPLTATLAWSWKASIQVLTTTEALQSVLRHRFQALQEGKTSFLNASGKKSRVDCLRLLWNQESFRRKVEKAAAMSSDPHVWKGHNFTTCPTDSNVLQHVMISAEDAATGQVVGFLEVAMMQSNVERRLSVDHHPPCCVPTIANVVISPNYQRLGIASGLLSSASRYVKQAWSDTEIALYVDKANTRACTLYRKCGFELISDTGDNCDKLYMSQPVVRKIDNSCPVWLIQS